MNSDFIKKYRYIMTDPEILSGKPVVAGTRISVSQVLRCLSHGMDLESIREMYGEFPAEAIPEVLRFASNCIEPAERLG